MTGREGSFLAQELERRRDARRAADLAQDFNQADALITPFVLALARLAARRDACNYNYVVGEND